MGHPVPPSTQFLLDVGAFGREYWIYLSLCFVVPPTLLLVFQRRPMVRAPLGKLMLYAPVLRDAYRPLAAGRHFRTIAAMVRGGVPLLQAIRLTRNTAVDPSWRQLLAKVESNLIDGTSASGALMTVDFLPSEAAQMMAAGERTGRVPEVLEDIGRFYEQESRRRIKRLVIAVEPMIILVMGMIVAGVVVSVVLPLLEVATIQGR